MLHKPDCKLWVSRSPERGQKGAAWSVLSAGLVVFGVLQGGSCTSPNTSPDELVLTDATVSDSPNDEDAGVGDLVQYSSDGDSSNGGSCSTDGLVIVTPCNDPPFLVGSYVPISVVSGDLQEDVEWTVSNDHFKLIKTAGEVKSITAISTDWGKETGEVCATVRDVRGSCRRACLAVAFEEPNVEVQMAGECSATSVVRAVGAISESAACSAPTTAFDCVHHNYGPVCSRVQVSDLNSVSALLTPGSFMSIAIWSQAPSQTCELTISAYSRGLWAGSEKLVLTVTKDVLTPLTSYYFEGLSPVLHVSSCPDAQWVAVCSSIAECCPKF